LIFSTWAKPAVRPRHPMTTISAILLFIVALLVYSPLCRW
jgi:hypothetical protein